MKKTLLFLVVFGLMAQVAFGETLLNYGDIQFFKVVESNSSNGTVLNVSGLAMHSALAIKEIKATVKGNLLFVSIGLTLANGKNSGSFSYQVEVPKDVTAVYLGKDEYLIWKRLK